MIRVGLELKGMVIVGGVAPDNTTLLTARLPRGLPNGAYIADMRLAFASDGRLFLGNDNTGDIIWIAPLDL